jgi:pimeloyl-ACP methyl ester carboxylesterase
VDPRSRIPRLARGPADPDPLFQDYQSNIDAYPAWQRFQRTRRPPTLIVWGRNDPACIVPGAEAYLRDVPEAQLRLVDAGHFAVEEQPVPIATTIVEFLERLPVRKRRPTAEGWARYSQPFRRNTT